MKANRYALVLLITLTVMNAFAMESLPSEQQAKSLYAVEIKVGKNWNSTKPPQEQAYFKEHSLNLQKLRKEGHIVMGARYSDIGLLIFSAHSAEEVKEYMSKDPSIEAGTFQYQVYPFNVFYAGTITK